MRRRLLLAVLVLVAACSSGARPHTTVTGPLTSGLAGVIIGDCNQPGSHARPPLTSADLQQHYGDRTGPGAQGVTRWASLVGVSSTFVSDYFTDTSMSDLRYQGYTIDCWRDYLAAHPGQNIIYGVPMLSDDEVPGQPDAPTMGQDILAGYRAGVSPDPKVNFDADFRALASTLVAGGQAHAYLRVGWEANCDCMFWPADVDPSAWVRYWRHIVTVMRAVPGAHFSFVWNVNNGYNTNDYVHGVYTGAAGEFNGEDAYPDDPSIDPGSYDKASAPYVDVVSDDIYDVNYEGDGVSTVGYPFPPKAGAATIAASQKHATATTLFGSEDGRVGHAGRHSAEWWREFANSHGKPFGISEWGLARNPDQPATGPYPGPTLDCTGRTPLPLIGNCHGGGDDPTFIHAVVSWLQTTYTSAHGSTPIAYAEYFDSSSADITVAGSGTDNRIDTPWTPRSLARLRADLRLAAQRGH